MLITLLCVFATSSFAARAGIETISGDPYTSAIVVDAATGKVLFEENADKPVYPASVIKLMDFLLILEWLDAGKAKLDDWIRVTPEAARMGGSQVYLKEGETFSLDEMLYALSIKSANDVALALAIHFAGTPDNFVKLMNNRAAALGMTSTKFTSVHGLPPSEGQEPDVSTARDIARLSMEVLKHPAALRYTSAKLKWFRNNTFEMRTHNRLLNEFPGCDGLKTGYFTAAGFSIAATAERNGRRVVAVVMGCTSRPTRDTKAKELLSQGFLDLPELPKPPPQELRIEKKSTRPVKKNDGGFLAGLKKGLLFMGKCLLWLLLVVTVIGVIAVVSFKIRQKREGWKYDL